MAPPINPPPRFATMAAAPQPTLSYWERAAPFAALALAKHAGVELKHEADPKATNKTVPSLRFDSG